MNNDRLSLQHPRWRAALAAGVSLAAAAFLVACGGGGDSTPTAATSYSQGAITGFGSVFVGGVRFDDSTASVDDEDGNSRSRSDLKLGMMVEVESGNIDRASATAQALRIRWGSEIVGPVGTINTVASTVSVLGQTVLVTSSTVFDSSLVGGLSALTAGAVIEVHGILDPANARIVATRIEPKTGVLTFKLRGVIASLDTTAKTFRIGTALISYAGVATVPASLANGALLKVRMQTTQMARAWVATRLGDARPRVEDADEAHLKGTITAFTSSAAFSVNGIPVDASHATFPNGTTAIVLGANVKVKGTSSNGTIVATRVSTETHEEAHAEGFELHGAITAIDSTAKTFVLRGITVNYAAQTVEFRRGTAATLAVGVQLEVRGLLSADGTTLAATRISFGD